MRGFVDAYAPALEDCGISQDEFLDFLQGFKSQVTDNQGYFNILNIAAALANLSTVAPYTGSLTVWLSAVAVQMSVEAASKMYANKKVNDYLGQMNEGYFKPQ